MENIFEKNLGALTRQEMDILSVKRIFVAGCGGLGGNITENLVRMGASFIRVCDGDSFELSNMNRQLYCTYGTLGKNKAYCARERALSINPDIRFEAVEQYISEENVSDLISSCDIVVDALDSINSRILLSRKCSELGIPYVFGAIHSWCVQCGVSNPGDRLVEKLYDGIDEPGESPSLSFAASMCASMESALTAEVLLGKNYDSGIIHIFDLSTFQYQTIRL